MGFCGLAASKYLRSVILLFRRLWPGGRRFRRYRKLGVELLEQLEKYRAMVKSDVRQPVST